MKKDEEYDKGDAEKEQEKGDDGRREEEQKSDANGDECRKYPMRANAMQDIILARIVQDIRVAKKCLQI